MKASQVINSIYLLSSLEAKKRGELERGFVTESLGEEWIRSLGTLGLEERALVGN